MIKSFENFQAFGKEGFEAYVASATAMTKGFQTIAGEMADYSRKSFEKGGRHDLEDKACRIRTSAREAGGDIRRVAIRADARVSGLRSSRLRP